ncbi:MAG: sugar phosphate isomerase/epimerase [Planctomycetaceae bacterium]|nr:sugar phosphate isomerase/epimerase [Planctomycetaceae bacterium]
MRRRELLVAATAVPMACMGEYAGLAKSPLEDRQGRDESRVPLGFDGHSMRAMKWKAPQFVQFAAEQNLDAVLINNLPLFESLEEAYLRRLKIEADRHGLRIFMGAGSICENGSSFNRKYGDAVSFLQKAIGVAKIVGSPVVTVRIGSLKDRFLEGGIQPRIDASIKVLKSLRHVAIDAGIKFGFENHGGDLRSEEVLSIINEVGPDVCGSMLDPGNAVWVMEDPMKQIQLLGKHVVCTSVRDYMVWETDEGATFQWTAVGDGLLDVPAYVQYLKTMCPAVPLFVESISNSPRPIPFLTSQWWTGFPDTRAADIADFLALCRRGRAMEVEIPPEGMSQKAFDRILQRNEFLKSVGFLRVHGAGQIG